MHLADAFIQSDLHCIQVTVFYILSALALPGNRTHDLGVASAMLYHLSYRKAERNEDGEQGRSAHLQLLLQAGDLSNAELSRLIGALDLMPLSRETETNVLQFTLQLWLLIILEKSQKEQQMSNY